MKTMREMTTASFVKGQVWANTLKNKVQKGLYNEDGSVSVEMALAIVIVLVIAGVAIALAVPYFKDVGSKVAEKTDEFFNFAG